jgi:hypothetical protein
MDNAFARMKVPHIIRYFLLSFALGSAYCAFIVPGLIWNANILKKTGYRGIDLLLIWCVPFGAMLVATRTQWRYCASTKYWEPAAPVAQKAEPVAA